MDAKTAGIHSSQKVIFKKFKGDAEKIKENNLEIDPASDFALKLTYKNPPPFFFKNPKSLAFRYGSEVSKTVRQSKIG